MRELHIFQTTFVQDLHIFQRRCRRISIVYILFIHFARETFRETFSDFSISILFCTMLTEQWSLREK